MKPTDIFRKSIEFIIKQKKIKQVDIANNINMGKSNFNSYLKGRIEISENKRIEICDYLNRDYIEMLKLGKALMEEKEAPDIETQTKLNDIFQKIKKINQNDLELLNKLIDKFIDK